MNNCNAMDNIQSIPLVMNVEEVAKLLGIGRNTAYDLIHSGQLKHIRIGRQIRITRTAILEYLGMPLN